MKRILIKMIKFYQKYLSPLKSTCCPYIPTCSQYGLEAIEKYGALKGGLLAAWRILRCNPFSKGGYDPVAVGYGRQGYKEDTVLGMLLTKSTMPIVNWVAEVLGWLMNGIYSIGVHNLGLCIIIFTIIIYAFMTPLQIKQQKFSKMNTIMQPELQKIQKKYKGKKDQNSQMKMQEETMAVYEKYGVSPTGSCLQLLIQMPIFFALYQVIIKIPGYIGGIKEVFSDAVDTDHQRQRIF